MSLMSAPIYANLLQFSDIIKLEQIKPVMYFLIADLIGILRNLYNCINFTFFAYLNISKILLKNTLFSSR